MATFPVRVFGAGSGPGIVDGNTDSSVKPCDTEFVDVEAGRRVVVVGRCCESTCCSITSISLFQH